jgi:ATP-dependent RNA circularization protein (DNA/RNA ligase family)
MEQLTNIEAAKEQEQIKYPKVLRYGKQREQFEKDDRIVVYEKLDGANASFVRIGDELVAFSRNTRLDESNNLRGFHQFVKTLDVNLFDVGLIYFGEWLVQHKLDYGENKNKFYLFDILDVSMGQGYGAFIDHQYVRIEAHELGLEMAPIFYEGPFISLDHVKTFVGKSMLGETGEGVVVKCVKKQLVAKIVSEAFAEAKGVKYHEPKAASVEMEFVKMFLTEARAEKMLHKLVDEGVLKEDFDISDMGTILRVAGPRIYEDMVEEESDTLPLCYDEKKLRAGVGKVVAPMLRKIIEGRA